MNYAIVITRPEGADPRVIGPYTSLKNADIVATRLNEAFDDIIDLELGGYAASVVPMTQPQRPRMPLGDLVNFIREDGWL